MTELVINELHKKEEYTAISRQRSSVYGLLALFYRHEPDEDLIRSLRQQEILQGLEEAGLSLNVNELCDGPIEAVIQRLKTEYTRLFIGPGKHVVLNESVYRDSEGLLWGKSTVAVKGFIEATGLDLDAEWSGLPDHISIELELMQRLTDHEAELWNYIPAGKYIWIENDLDSVRRCIGTEREFMQKHLLQWVPLLCDMILDQIPLSFYSEISQFTKNFVTFDSKFINNLFQNIILFNNNVNHEEKKGEVK